LVEPERTVPRDAAVERVLAGEIQDGTLAQGDRLPTEEQLERRFGVSRITVRRAVQNLATRGLVEVRWGRGTFVAAPRITQPLTSLTGFVEDMAAIGRRSSARVVTVETVPADPATAVALGLDPGTLVTHIERVRLADERPISLDDTYLPTDLGARVAEADLVNRPVFELLEQDLGVPLGEAVYRLRAEVADAHTAAELGIVPGAPVFRIDRTSASTTGRPVDHETLRYRGDAITFETRLPRG
jgi:GntR family transcriptional regulator